MDLNSKIRLELCKDLGLKVSDEETATLEIHLGDWIDVVDENFFRLGCSGFSRLALIIKDATSCRDEVVEWISKYVSPRMVKIVIAGCGSFTWKHQIKPILANANTIETIDFRKNGWESDSVLEQLTIKFGKNLRSLNLENCKITNNALFHVGKRCLSLRELGLDCCPKLTDTGMIEIARRIHLASLVISHNVAITDNGIETILSVSSNLSAMALINCPNLTDRSMATLFEAIVVWGKKRNTKSKSMRSLELRDNLNFTEASLLYISTGLPNLTSLDIRDCPNINLSKGLKMIEGLSKLESLKLGPSERTPDVDAVVESLLFHMANLKQLHLCGIKDLDDSHIAELLDAALLLDDITLIDLQVGTLAVEALCSNLPNTLKLNISGSERLRDADVRCLASVCLHLEELTLQRNATITDGAFTRCNGLKRLHKLDVSHSRGCNGSLLLSFSQCPLTDLALDNICFDLAPPVSRMAFKTLQVLQTLSLRDAQGVTVGCIEFILDNCPRCSLVDLTGALNRSRPIGKVNNRHPFLTYQGGNDFVGFKCGLDEKRKMVQFFKSTEQIRKHHAAKLWTRAWSSHREYLKEKEQEMVVQHQHLRIAMIVKLQALFRRVRAKGMVRARRAAALIILKACIAFSYRQNELKMIKARRHCRRACLWKHFVMLEVHRARSRKNMRKLVRTLHPKVNERLQKKYFIPFLPTLDDIEEEEICARAPVMWEGHLLNRVVSHWKTIIGSTRIRKLLLIGVFLNAVPTRYRNSMRQVRHSARADHFRLQKLLAPAWLCFCEDFMRARKAQLLEQLALAHFKKTFLKRVMDKLFKVLVQYAISKRVKRLAKARAVAYQELINKKLMIHQSREMITRCKYGREKMQIALTGRERFQRKNTIKLKMAFFTRRTKLFKRIFAGASTHHRRVLLQKAFKQHHYFVDMMKWWHIHTARALELYHHKILRMVYAAWRYAVENAQSLDEDEKSYCQRRYLLIVCAKIIRALRGAVLASKQYLREVEAALEAKRLQAEAEGRAVLAAREAENALQAQIRRVTLAQARWRGVMGRRYVQEYRVRRMYAVMVLQGFARRGIALLKYKRLVRLRMIKMNMREEVELEMMREEEVAMRYFMYKESAIVLIQRCFRGFLGREEARRVVFNVVEEKSRAYYTGIGEVRHYLAVKKKEDLKRENLEKRSSILIQTHVRGLRARKFFERLKAKQTRERAIVRVQSFYRSRIAQQRLSALRRAKFGELRVQAARKQRGFLMRLLGFSKRKVQKHLVNFLEKTGTDPLSFNYKPSEVFRETIQDFYELKWILEREYKIFRHIRDPTERILVRKRELKDRGYQFKLYDTVKITDEDHAYYGHTGVIVRIDFTLAGPPLYEVLLDRFRMEVFTRMSSDALAIYENTSRNLHHTDPFPKVFPFSQPFRIFGIDPSQKLFQKKNVAAAWTIQRAWRCHRARKLVARVRYEFWANTITQQKHLYVTLADTNALTTQANNMANWLRLRPNKPIFFDEIRHLILPAQYTSMLKNIPEKIVVKKEFEVWRPI